MNRRRLVTTLLLAGMATMQPANARERKDIPVPLTWDLSAIYASPADWQAALARVQNRIPELGKFQGHLGDSPSALYDALKSHLDARKELDRVYAYATFMADQDARNSQNQEMRQKAQQAASEMEATTSYFEPELIGLGQERVQKLIAAEPRLQAYQAIFDDILRGAAHTLSPAEEKVAAQASDLLDAGQNVHSIFTDAEMPYPEIKLSTGEKVKLDAAGYTRYRSVPNRADRLKVFKTFWTRYRQYRRTLATTLYEQIKGHMFDKKVHKFESALEAALFPNNVPPEVYHQLLRDVHANLPTLHRYLKLRQRLMKLPQLGYEDLYAPIVSGVELTYTPEQAMDLTLKSSVPLGAPYLEALQRAYKDRWVDFLPSTGKRSGAYSSGDVYDVHPYQLLNYNGKYEDVSTLAHESGHSLHSYLSNKAQPYGLHSYPIFVAEVASTLNENLLFHYMLEHTQSKATRMSLLGSYLENMRGTLFRQTMLAEFELRVHEMVEAGQPLTGDNLSQLYLKLLREYYGHDKSVCKIDDLYGVEWAYIPHFYYNFYVFQYATSLVASTSLASNILAEEKAGSTAARDAYLKMLSTGASEYPLTQLQKAGVDMRTSKPFAAAMREMNEIMDQMEALEKS